MTAPGPYPVPAPELPTPEDYRHVARELRAGRLGEDDVTIPTGAQVVPFAADLNPSRPAAGAWVEAFVWVPFDLAADRARERATAELEVNCDA